MVLRRLLRIIYVHPRTRKAGTLVGLAVLLATIGLLLFGPKELTAAIGTGFDHVKSEEHNKAFIPLWVVINVVGIIACLPLFSYQILSGFFFGSKLGTLINIYGSCVGVVCCMLLSKKFPSLRQFFQRLHPSFSHYAATEGFLYVFFNVFTPQLNVGTAVYLLNEENIIVNSTAVLLTVITLSASYSVIGTVVDPFVQFCINRGLHNMLESGSHHRQHHCTD